MSETENHRCHVCGRTFESTEAVERHVYEQGLIY